MEQTQTRASTPRPVIFRDGIGRRCRMLDVKGMEKLEVLCLHPSIASESFESALRDRVGRLTSFRHSAFAKVRAVQHLKDAAATLVLVSECTPGLRLSELLATAQREGVALDSGAAWSIVRQLVAAIAALHEHAPEVAHGAIASERIVITPDARLVVVEHVLGSALAGLRYSQDRYWKELRIAAPHAKGAATLDLRADVMQLGVVALSVVLGRPLHDEEFPARTAELIESASITSTNGDDEPMPLGLRTWLDRALQLDERRSFTSAIEAGVELDKVLAETESILVPLALEAFLTRFHQQANASKRTSAGASWSNTEGTQETFQGSEPAVAKAESSQAPVASVDRERPAHAGGKAPASTKILETGAGSRKNHDDRRATNPVLAEFDRPSTEKEKKPGKQAWRRPNWPQKPWGRQTITALLLTVLCGAGWLFASRVSEVRAENVTPEPPAPLAATGDATPAVDVSKPAASVAPAVESQPIPAPTEVAAKPAVVTPPVATTTAQPTAAPVTPPASGWISVSAPADLQVWTNGVLRGTSQGGRIGLTTGSHQIELVNDAIGFRSTRTVQVKNAETANINVDLPNGTLALNATPWAEVIIDGKSVGETPLGNLPIRVGTHEVVFRHPELGERRMTATVTLTTPTRLSVDLRKP